MPSFYPRSMPHGLPPTPPEFVPSYIGSGCGGLQYQQSLYDSSQQGHVGQEDSCWNITDRYAQPSTQAAPPTMHYPGSNVYANTARGASSVNHQYEPLAASTLPSMHSHDSALAFGGEFNRQVAHSQQSYPQQQQRKDDKPVGGVSASLDYDMECMTDFVAEMTQGIIQPGRPLPPSFRKWVHQLLCATRLPSATILLGLRYLAIRMTMLSNGTQYRAAEGQIYRFLTTALILGSKFLDDNTFINRSWAEVSGIDVAVLNHLETEWLGAIEFNLHRNPMETNGYCAWHAQWQEYEAQYGTRATRSLKLDTGLQRQRSAHKSYASSLQQSHFSKPTAKEFVPKSQHSQYNPSAYAQYDPWLAPPSATDSSPTSAPHTGPTTPEYYGGPGIWAPLGGYSRRSIYGLPSIQGLTLQSSQSHVPSQSSTYGHAAYTPQYNSHLWSGHGIGCNCMYCARQHPSYAMPHGLPVAG